MSKHRAKKAGDAQPPVTAGTGADAVPSIAFLFDWNAEITKFYLSRFQNYGLVPWRLQSCTTPEDFSELQADFQRQLAEDYEGVAGRLSQIAGASEHSAGTRQDSDYAAGLLKAQEDAKAIIEQAKAQAASIVAEARERASEDAAKAEKVSKKTA